MADLPKDKKLKLANTRKRFKELQELKKKKHDNSPSPNPDNGEKAKSNINETINQSNFTEHVSETPVESLTNSAHSSVNADVFTENNVLKNEAGLNNYFVSNQDMSGMSPAQFFDNIGMSQNKESVITVPNSSTSAFLNYFNPSPTYDKQPATHTPEIATYSDNTIPDNSEISQTPHETSEHTRYLEDYTLFAGNDNNFATDSDNITLDDRGLSLDYPEIKQNEILQYHNKDILNESCTNTAPQNIQQVEEDSVTADDLIFSEQTAKNLISYLNSNTQYTKQEAHSQALQIQEEIDSSSNAARNEVQHSNVESLRQLSDQMAQMIEPSYEYSSNGSITDLEKRNLELAALYEKEKLNNEQLKKVLEENEKKIAQKESEVADASVGLNLQASQEISRLKEELQTHFQTIGMLVAEKTELAANLGQYEMASKQKSGECEELQARLKASRSRVADLERELGNFKTAKSKTENLEQEYSSALTKLRMEYQYLKEQHDELTQDLLEVREKLKNSSEANITLQKENQEFSSKLSLAEIKIQQLTSGESFNVDVRVEQLTQEKFSLEKEVANLNQMLKSIIKERDESSMHYQQYAEQLNAQLLNLSAKLEELRQEKENLLLQDQNRIKHIGELERQLQNFQDNQILFATRSIANELEVKNEMSEVAPELCVELQMEKTILEENFTKVTNEKDLLLKELEAKNDSLSQLESLVEQLRGNQPDSVKLLAAMESDKVAAARAVQQNKEIKQQMEGMQEVFLKLSNDKVDLTEKLTKEEQTNKELFEKLQHTEIHLQTLADAIEIKDRELSHLRENSTELNKQVLHHEQLEDRLRHFEAQDNCSHVIQQELQEAKHTIAKLTNELHQLKMHSSEQGDRKEKIGSDDLETKLEQMRIEPKFENEIKTELKVNEVNTEKPDSNENILDKDHTLQFLEEKVKKTMQEIADLTEEKQRLEHIVLQLQGETETIGEYVALYQHQRMVLKQKAIEKDQQLKQLANDREQIKVKLDRLNELITKLVNENGVVPAELIQHQKLSSLNVPPIEEKKVEDNIKKTESNVIENEDGKHSHTAEEIISLLSEIKTSNLVQPDENYHHCPWCSGQLITV